MIAHLVFKNLDGSLTWAGYFFLGVGVLMVGGAFLNITGRTPRRWVPQNFPRRLQIAAGVVGAGAGIGIACAALLASNGVLY
jgi:hypothetical protein